MFGEQKESKYRRWLVYKGFPGELVEKHLPAQTGDAVRSLGGEDPGRRKWQRTPVFLPGESQGQRSLADYSPWSFKDQT